MLFKTILIKGCPTCKAVHVFLDRNDGGEDFVRLLAWHETENGLFIQTMEADVFSKNKGDNSLTMMQRYIADFSEMSANEFANTMIF